MAALQALGTRQWHWWKRQSADPFRVIFLDAERVNKKMKRWEQENTRATTRSGFSAKNWRTDEIITILWECLEVFQLQKEEEAYWHVFGMFVACLSTMWVCMAGTKFKNNNPHLTNTQRAWCQRGCLNMSWRKSLEVKYLILEGQESCWSFALYQLQYR